MGTSGAASKLPGEVCPGAIETVLTVGGSES